MTCQAKTDWTLSRRNLLRWLGAVGAGAAYGSAGGCDDSSSGAGARDAGDAGDATAVREAGAAEGGTPVTADGGTSSALDALRTLLRKSPDHLVARATDVVATKDPTKIAEFVRDHITVLPGIGRSDDPELAAYSRWGAMPTLRAGAGSLRDRADLMVVLLGAAGIASTVKAMKTPSGLTAAVLYAPRTNTFSVDSGELEGVTKIPASSVATNVSDASDESDAFFDATVSAIVNAAKAAATNLPKADLPVPTHLPVVIPGASDGSSGNPTVLVAVGTQAVTSVDATTLVAATETNIPNVSITVTALMNPPAGGGDPTYSDLVTGSWPIDQVAGCQAQVIFMPQDGAVAALTGLGAERIRVPAIRIQPRPGIDLDPYANALLPPSMRSSGTDGGAPTASELGKTGAPITIDGEIVSVSTAGMPSPEAPILVLDKSAHKAAVAAVAKIDGTINATTFTTVELDLSIDDAQGNSVDGLVAADLAVTEDGAPMAITVATNRTPAHPPRVLIAYDASGSITNFWPSAAARQAFETSLATALTDIAGQEPFETQVIGIGGNVDPKGWAAPSVKGLTTAMESASSLSDVWATFVGSGVDSGPAVIIMVSDFDDPDPTYVEAAKQRLGRAGIPVIALAVGTVNESIASQIVAASSGVEIPAGSSSMSSKVSAVVSKAVAQRASVSYRIRYDAPSSGKSTRSVKVALATDSSIATTLSYDVPAASARITPPSVAAVYVTIQFAGVIERRWLGGAYVSDRGTPFDDIQSRAVIDDARAVLDGVTTIAIEPASPQLALVLDDIVLSHQSLGPLRKAWSMTDEQALISAGARTYRFPGVFATLLPAPPPAAGAPIVVPIGLRVAILCERPSNGQIARQIDMPPRLNAMRALTGGATDLEAVVRATLLTSLNEARVFDDSAYDQLAHRQFETVPTLAGLAMALQDAYSKNPVAATNLAHLMTDYEDLIRLVPTDGGTVAFWVVDPATGSVAAVDATGRGGGSSSVSDLVLFLNIVLFCLATPCSFYPPGDTTPKYSVYCIGLTVLSVGATVAGLLTQSPGPPTAFGVFATVFGATTKIKPGPPKLLGRNVFITCFLILLLLISLEKFD